MAPPRRRSTPSSRTQRTQRRARSRMRGLVGRDFSAYELRGGPRRWVPIGLAVLVAAFGLVALRTEVLKFRYALAQGLEREQALQSERRDLTVRMRTLRDPMRLAERAVELGFVRPERIVDLDAMPLDSGSRPESGNRPGSSAPAAEASTRLARAADALAGPRFEETLEHRGLRP